MKAGWKSLPRPLPRLLIGCAFTALAIFLIAAVFIFSEKASAAQTVPYKVNFQGRLTNSAGNAMADGQYNIKFRLYSVSTGGVAVWEETRETTNRVQVTNGLFSVQLGDVMALSPSVFTSQPLYFEVELPTTATATCSTAACATFNGTEIMTPRQPLGASPYAMNADTLDGVDMPSFARRDENNTFTGTQLFKNTADSATAFRIQNVAAATLLTVDTSANQVVFGTSSSLTGKLVVANATNINTVTIVSGATTSSYQLTLPAALGASGDCLKDTNGTGVLGFASCATVSTTLQDAYANSTDPATITTTSTTKGIVIKSGATFDSASLFKIQNAAASSIFSVDSSGGQVVLGQASTIAGKLLVANAVNANTITIVTGTTTGSYSLTLPTGLGVSGDCIKDTTGTGVLGFGSCGAAAVSQRVTLVPEYVGAVLTPDGTSNVMNVISGSVSGLVSGQGYKHNYYQWDTSSATAQDYDIVINYQLPSSFTSFVSGSFNLWTYADSLTSTDVTVMVKSSTDALCYAAAVSVKPTTAATWQNKLPGNPANGCTFAANDMVTFIIKPTVIQPNTNKVRIGEFSFAYQ